MQSMVAPDAQKLIAHIIQMRWPRMAAYRIVPLLHALVKGIHMNDAEHVESGWMNFEGKRIEIRGHGLYRAGTASYGTLCYYAEVARFTRKGEVFAVVVPCGAGFYPEVVRASGSPNPDSLEIRADYFADPSHWYPLSTARELPCWEASQGVDLLGEVA